MFIISTAKVRQINDTTKYFVLKKCKRIDLFSIAVQASADPDSSGFNLTEIK